MPVTADYNHTTRDLLGQTITRGKADVLNVVQGLLPAANVARAMDQADRAGVDTSAHRAEALAVFDREHPRAESPTPMEVYFAGLCRSIKEEPTPGPKELPTLTRSIKVALRDELTRTAVLRQDLAGPDAVTLQRSYEAALIGRHGPAVWHQVRPRPGDWVPSNVSREEKRAAYEALMRHTPHGYVPDERDIFALMIEECREFDNNKKACTRSLLDSFMCRRVGWPSVQRTGVGAYGSGPGGFGFTLPVSMAESVVDRARQVVGPWNLCRWEPTPTRTFHLPIVAETSRARGSRYGGITSTIGEGEVLLAPPTDGKLGMLELNANRVTVLSYLSRDLFADARIAADWVVYTHTAEMRAAIESCLISAPNEATVAAGTCPQPVIGAASTVVVTRSPTTATVSSLDVDALWAAIAPGNKATAVWHANGATIQAIDQLAVSGQFPEAIYWPARGGMPATIKGRPLIECDYCPALGQTGDLIVVDWNDYVMKYVSASPLTSMLTFRVSVPDYQYHRGIVGLPDGSVECRMSDQCLFTTDLLAFASKIRCAGHFIWGGTTTDLQGNIQGPAAVLTTHTT
ncbi:MAG: phage major capsid protein [Thermoguttaceae bacterium]